MSGPVQDRGSSAWHGRGSPRTVHSSPGGGSLNSSPFSRALRRRWFHSRHRLSVAVYPRVCGGTIRPNLGIIVRVGLSPRLRGNPCRLCRGLVAPGSIPAFAGEPTQPEGDVYVTGVYPRVCGGTITAYSAPAMVTGLSPRLRGNLRGRTKVHRKRGSIPAFAGEPGTQWRESHQTRVYPRVCGGTYCKPHLEVLRGGLSPRLRGNRLG